MLISKLSNTGLKHYNDPKTFLNAGMICKMSAKTKISTIELRNEKC